MDALDNRLEERLTRLEGGEPLAACLADLPDDEALLLKKAARLNAIAETTLVSNRLLIQRRELMRLAKENNKMKTSASPLVSGKAQSRWIFPVAVTGGAFAVFTCMVVFSLVAGMLGLRWLNLSRGVALEAPDAQSARIQELRGLVEVQDDSGAWEVVEVGQVLEAGQSIRTGKLSSVAIGFYDGSKTQLGPDAEMSIDELDAQDSGPRVIVLSQSLGESQHDVAKSNDPASRYEVHTPSGVGVAKGTSFRVFVTVTLFVRFVVDEGAVAVTNLDTTVMVVAGQITVIIAGHTPTQPVFRIEGEGVVEKTGSVWHIAGRTFRTDSNTVFGGDPQVGDVVAFEARVVRDGSPILDSVVLLADTTENRFSFSGTVDSMSDTEWSISGKTVQVDEMTDIDAFIDVGDRVKVAGRILEDGTWVTSSIKLIEDTKPHKFNFTGIVSSTNPWDVSGISFSTDEDTAIDPQIMVGDEVRVQGVILPDGIWLAESIVRLEDDDDDLGCLSFSTAVREAGTNQIVLQDWQVVQLDDDIEVDGQINIATIVMVSGCTQGNGSFTITHIIVIYQLDSLPIFDKPPSQNSDDDDDDDDDDD